MEVRRGQLIPQLSLYKECKYHVSASVLHLLLYCAVHSQFGSVKYKISLGSNPVSINKLKLINFSTHNKFLHL